MNSHLLSVTLAAALAASSAARAPSLRVLVLIGGERERELASRVQGHTADLDVQLSVVEAPELSAERPVDAALSEAADRAADVVVWFAPDVDGWVVRVARGHRVFRRRVRQSTGAMSESASTEAAALVVRTALKGLVAGEEMPVEEPEPPAPSPPRLWGELGWTGVVERQGPAGRQGMEGQLGGALGNWSLAAAVEYHPAVQIASASTSIQVERLMAGLMAGVDLLGRPGAGARFRLGPQLTLAAARYARTTSSVGSGLAPTSAKATWTPVVTPAISVSVRMTSRVWVSATLGADVLGRKPEFGVEGTGGFETLTTLWPMEPRATLSLLIDAF